MIDFDALLGNFNVKELLSSEFRRQLEEYIEHTTNAAGEPENATERKQTGEDEDCSGDFLFAVYDQRNLLSRPRRKWYSPKTTTSRKKGICVHHTAVHGGHGPHRSKVNEYLRRGVQDYSASSPWLVAPMDPDYGRAVEPTREEWARAMALACRFRGEPAQKYNYGLSYQVISAANSVLYLNLPFDWVTWHGNGANRDYLGFAWDMDSRKAGPTADDPACEDVLADLQYTLNLARSEGHPIERVTTHSAWTNKPHDPGALFIENVIVPFAEKNALVVDWDFKVEGGRSMAETVREAA